MHPLKLSPFHLQQAFGYRWMTEVIGKVLNIGGSQRTEHDRKAMAVRDRWEVDNLVDKNANHSF